MNKVPVPVCVAATFFVFILTAATQEKQPPLSMDKVMTAEEMRETGILSLSTLQRVALDRWLNAYTVKAFRAAHRVGREPGADARPGSEYPSTGLGHWIQDNGDGKIITLEDGSLWQIIDSDQVDTILWLPVTDITVLRNASAAGDFEYLLVNTEDGEKAVAKYLGK